MSNIERLSEEEIGAAFTGEPHTGVPFEMVVQIARAIESAVHAKLSAPVEVGEAPVAEAAAYEMLMALAGVDTHDISLRDHPDAWAAVERYSASLVEQQAREIAELKGLAERLKKEAQIHAQEARTANSTIAEIYRCVSGGTGEPGNWNGAKPVRELLDDQRARLSRQGEVIKRAAEELGDLRHRFHMACISTGSDVWAADCACAKADAVIDELRSVEGV